MAIERVRRTWRTSATAVFVVLLALPVALNRDGLPLSTFPMYASPRSGEVSFVVPYGVELDGSSHRLPMRTSAATVDPLVAESSLSDAVAEGRGDELCATIAARLDPGTFDLIEVRLQRHDVVDHARSAQSLLEEQIVATCAAP